MISYKNVGRFSYTKNPADVVALREYILYEDAKEQARYALLKFVNNLDQSLYGVQFEVYQYDGEEKLLEKSLVVYDKFNAGAQQSFVPKAKLRLNIQCRSLSVKLISAAFERVRWEKGTFVDNSYSFGRYVQDVRAVPASKPASQTTAPLPPAEQTKGRPNKRQSAAFHRQDEFRKNFAVFPTVFTVFVVIALVAFVAASAYLFRRNAKAYTFENFGVVELSEETVGITSYEGKEREIVIPARINDKTVVKIVSGAFRRCAFTKVTIEAADVTIERQAFADCASLTSVVATERVYVLENAFEACEALQNVYMPAATVSTSAFGVGVRLAGLTIGKTADATLADLFKEEQDRFVAFSMNDAPTDGFFDGVSTLTSIRITADSVRDGALVGCANLTYLELHVRSVGSRFLSLFAKEDTTSVSLETVVLDTPTIAYEYFFGCADGGITVDNVFLFNVLSVGSDAFTGLGRLKSVYLPTTLGYDDTLFAALNKVSVETAYFEGEAVQTDNLNVGNCVFAYDISQRLYAFDRVVES